MSAGAEGPEQRIKAHAQKGMFGQSSKKAMKNKGYEFASGFSAKIHPLITLENEKCDEQEP